MLSISSSTSDFNISVVLSNGILVSCTDIGSVITARSTSKSLFCIASTELFSHLFSIESSNSTFSTLPDGCFLKLCLDTNNLSTSKSEPVSFVNSDGSTIVSPILAGNTSTILNPDIEDSPCVGILYPIAIGLAFSPIILWRISHSFCFLGDFLWMYAGIMSLNRLKDTIASILPSGFIKLSRFPPLSLYSWFLSSIDFTPKADICMNMPPGVSMSIVSFITYEAILLSTQASSNKA